MNTTKLLLLCFGAFLYGAGAQVAATSLFGFSALVFVVTLLFTYATSYLISYAVVRSGWLSN